ncbi:MAG: hypothetical protein ACFCUO_11525 [Rhodospirillales bacterium]
MGTRRKPRTRGGRPSAADETGSAGDADLQAAATSFLAPEFGAKLDESGEPLPVRFSELSFDPGLKQLAAKLWRDFQGGRASVEKAIEGAGLGKEDLWKPGISETLTTSSSPDEIARYRQKLQFRADFLEAALEETLVQIEGLEHYASNGDGGAWSGDGTVDRHANEDGGEDRPADA